MAKFPTLLRQAASSTALQGGSGRVSPVSTAISTPRASVPRAPNLPDVEVGDGLGINFAPFLKDLSTVGASLQNRLKKREDLSDMMWVEDHSSETRVKYLGHLKALGENPSDDIIAKLDTDYTEYVGKLLEDSPSDKATYALTRDLNSFRETLLGASLGIKARLNVQRNITSLNKIFTNASDIISKDPRAETLAEQQQNLITLVNASRGQGAIDEKVHRSYIDSIHNLSAELAENLVGDDPRAAQGILDDAKHLSLPVRTRIQSKIDRALSTLGNLAVFRAKQDLENNKVSILKNGKEDPNWDIADYADIMTPAAVEEAEGEIQTNKDLYAAQESMRAQSPNEMNTILAEFVGDDRLSYMRDAMIPRLTTFRNNQEKLLNTDPYAYTMQSPVMGSLAKQFDSISEDNEALRLATMQKMIETSYLIQKHLGINDGVRAPIPLDRAEEIAGFLNGADPNDIGPKLREVMTLYGDYYPDVFRTLVGLPKSQRIDTSIHITALHPNAIWIKEFNDAMRVDESEYNFSNDNNNLFEDTAVTHSDIDNFMRASVAADSSEDRTSYAFGFQSSIIKYAKSLYFRGKVNSPVKAINLATDRIINSKYSFDEINGQVYAIRRDLRSTDGTPVDLDDSDFNKINAFLEQKIKSGSLGLQLDDLDLSNFYSTFTMGDEAKLREVSNALRRNTFWVTTEDDQSARLYLKGRDDTSDPVRYKDQTLVEFNFSEIPALYDLDRHKGRARRGGRPIRDNLGTEGETRSSLGAPDSAKRLVESLPNDAVPLNTQSPQGSQP